MLGILKRYAVIFTIILVFSFSFVDAYAQSPSAETQSKKTAYITLDDGPSRSITAINLDTLKKYGVKATFFVLPRNGVDDLYKRIVEEGHAIGNHSYSHDYNYLYSSTENFKKDVIKAGNFIFEKTGYTSTVFRFPGGTMGRGKAVISARAGILAGLGYHYFDWDVSTADTDPNLKTYGNEEHIASILTNNILNNTRNRKTLIILMHDTSKYSAKALPRIIEGLQKQGYVFDVLTNDGDWQYELNEKGEAVITGYIGDNTAVTVPSMLEGHTVTSIDSDVFTDDPIASINIPDSVVNIDSGAFWECRTLKAINFSGGNPIYKSVDGVAFSDDGTVLFHYPGGKTQPSDAYTVPQGVMTIGRCAFDHNQTLKKIVMPNSVARIEEAAFWRCTALKSFDIPSSVKEIGSSVFANCGELTAITVASGNPSFKSVDGVVFDITGALLKQYPPGKSGSYTIPVGVNIIGEGAFRGSTGLTQVILGDSVSRIDGAAFAFCEGLMDVQLGNRLLSVGGIAFQSCFSLQSIIMPQSLEVVEGMAFESCESLTDIYFLGDIPDFGGNIFQNTSKEFSVNYLESRMESWTDYSDYPHKPFSDIPYFNDVASGAWYNKAVNFIAARGITTGAGNGNFSPNAKLARGQFITLLMRAYGIEPDTNPTDNFADAGSTYYTGYIAAAKRLGISGGVGNNLFAPEKEITRQEMFTLLYNALKAIDRLPQGGSGKTLSDFTDAGQIEPWAKDAMALLVETGIIGGGSLTPAGIATRAEMAQVLYNLLSK
jgi:peptidoglycan/xylan/chitin deacetylase (PgdA/CDA1 family)